MNAGMQIALKRIIECKNTRSEKLILRGLGLTQLPDELWGLTHLKILDLELTAPGLILTGQPNRLRTLPPEIGRLTRLEELRIMGLKLSKLPPEIGNLIQLRDLYVSYNNLEYLPTEMEQLNKLRVLDLSNNKLEYLSFDISKLAQVRRLLLGDNRIKRFPKGIEKLLVLEYLDLSNNKIAELPREIEYLKKLKVLHLTNNQIVDIPSQIQHLVRLEKLYLAGNLLLELPFQIEHLSNLEVLEISGNKIASLPLDITNLTALQKFYALETSLSIPQELLNKPEEPQLIFDYLRATQSSTTESRIKPEQQEEKHIGDTPKPLLSRQDRKTLVTMLKQVIGIQAKVWELFLEDAGLEFYHSQLDFNLDLHNFCLQLIKVINNGGDHPTTKQPAFLLLLEELRERRSGHPDDVAFLDALVREWS